VALWGLGLLFPRSEISMHARTYVCCPIVPGLSMRSTAKPKLCYARALWSRSEREGRIACIACLFHSLHCRLDPSRVKAQSTINTCCQTNYASLPVPGLSSPSPGHAPTQV
jgi:hypothetical protein